MLLAKNIRCITGVVKSIATKNSGCIVPMRTFKSALKIKWVRPAHIPSIRPEKSGDGGFDLNITSKDYSYYFEKSKELEDADEIVKRMFTLEFLPRKETHLKKKEKTLSKVGTFTGAPDSMEGMLAALTNEILNLQEYMLDHPRNKKTAHFLKELIDKRKKYLNKLRKTDYKKFEWLLEKLNLVFKPYPPRYMRVTRKQSMRNLTRQHCNKLKATKLNAYRKELELELKTFLVEKAEKLEFIRNEEIACGKEPTVTEEEIAEAKIVAERTNQRSRGTREIEG